MAKPSKMSKDDYYIRPPGIRERLGAGGVVARVEGGDVLIALIRDRKGHDYVLPKGGVERSESLEQAARREIAEEAGFFKLISLGELGVGQRLTGRRKCWQTTHYFLFRTEETEGRPTHHVGWDVDWFKLDDLPGIYWREQRDLIVSNRKLIQRKMLDGARD